MRHTGFIAGAIAALGLAFLATPGQAAPIGGSALDLKSTAGEATQIEQVRHRCYRHRGHWHCPRHRYYRYRPGLHFHFGPRRHFHGHHRHHRHHGHHRRHWHN